MEPIRSRVRWKRPWWLPKKYRAVCLPPLGIWVDPAFKNSSLGAKIVTHELVHWYQFAQRPLSYYPRHIWYLLRNTPPHKNPLEVEAFEMSDVW